MIVFKADSKALTAIGNRLALSMDRWFTLEEVVIPDIPTEKFHEAIEFLIGTEMLKVKKDPETGGT